MHFSFYRKRQGGAPAFRRGKFELRHYQGQIMKKFDIHYISSLVKYLIDEGITGSVLYHSPKGF